MHFLECTYQILRVLGKNGNNYTNYCNHFLLSILLFHTPIPIDEQKKQQKPSVFPCCSHESTFIIHHQQFAISNSPKYNKKNNPNVCVQMAEPIRKVENVYVYDMQFWQKCHLQLKITHFLAFP